MDSSWSILPGETFIDDISGLRVRGLGSRTALIFLEAENIRKAVSKYLASRPSRRLAPFDLPWVKRLHREMLGEVWTWAGKIRQTPITFGDKEGTPAYRIESDLANLLSDLRAWEQTEMARIEQAARLHYRAVMIHPFINGNGRWGRMLANIWLRQHDQPVILWPESNISAVSPIREQYLDALRQMDDGHEAPFIDLHRRYAERGKQIPFESGSEESKSE